MNFASHVLPSSLEAPHAELAASSKPCASCGRELRFYHLDMTPKPPPEGDVTCSGCDARAIVRPLGCVARSL
jgi:hypothetical protein